MTKDEYFEIGAKHGLVAGGITFLGAWAYCASTYGFLLGFGLGWLASGILAAIVYFIIRIIWLPIDLVIGLGAFYVFSQSSRQSATIAPPSEATSYVSEPPHRPNLEMSSLEMGLLRDQIAACWDTPSDITSADQMPVEIVIQMNQDRTVHNARIVDQTRMKNDRNFREVGESALQALKNPKCNQLNLPPEKFSQWQVINFTFDPRYTH